MDKIKVLVAADIAKYRELYIEALLEDEDIQIVGEVTKVEDALKKVKQLSPDVVLVDINLSEPNGIQLAEKISRGYVGIGVLVVGDFNIAEYVKKAMLAGARDYISKPIEKSEIADAVRRVYHTEKERINMLGKSGLIKQSRFDDNPQIITILGTKGGAGRTMLTCNLAVQLKMQTGKKVAVVDLDLQFGDLAVFFNLKPTMSIAELSQERNKLNIEIVEKYLVQHRCGVKLLAAPTRPEFSDLVNTETIMEALKVLKDNYDYVIVDTPPFFPEHVLNALDMSTQILNVMSVDVPSIKNMKLNLNILETLHHKIKTKLIINRYNKDFGITIKKIEEALDFKVSKLIPSDGKVVVKATNEGKPFVLGRSNTEVTKSIVSIANMIIEETGDNPSFVGKERRKGFLKLRK